MAATPKREVFKAADVCEVAQVPPYVLRSWEAEFPNIGQVPSGGGARVYRRADIEMVLRIKQLVFDQGLTLSGARRRLEEDSSPGNSAGVLVGEVLGDRVRESLKNVKSGLESILALLSSDGEARPELQLVAPSAPKSAPRKKSAAKPRKK
ncbi:MAG TPA: MerR family transcriptional regulator [Vicinamibacterales bacterium]|nr:MerR family transcriptional regulator [Vicinamibacterales bacterium]